MESRSKRRRLASVFFKTIRNLAAVRAFIWEEPNTIRGFQSNITAMLFEELFVILTVAIVDFSAATESRWAVAVDQVTTSLFRYLPNA